jgi:MerR family transcriptional regulator, light-induced transcriptional regulator
MKGYRIKTVSRMTGMSPELLRAWERRHGVVTPQRTTGGYREYSEADVERLRLLALLTSRGYSIGEIAGLALDELGEMIRSPIPSAPTAGPPAPGSGNLVVEQLGALARDGDALGFRRALRRILVLLPARQVVGSVLLPLLQELSSGDPGEASQAARQLAGEEIRGYLGPLADEASPSAPLALVAVAEGDEAAGPDGLRAMLAAAQRGWRTVSLGRMISPGLLAACASRSSAAAAVLVCPSAPTATTLLGLIEAWGRAGPDDCRLILVGGDRGLLAQAAREHGVRVVRDDLELPAVLREIEDLSSGRPD